MDFGSQKNARLIAKQKLIIIALIVLSAFLFIAALVQTLSKVVITRQLEEANEAVLVAQNSAQGVESKSSSLETRAGELQEKVDEGNVRILELENTISNQQSRISRLEREKKELKDRIAALAGEKAENEEAQEDEETDEAINDEATEGEAEDTEGDEDEERKDDSSSSMTPREAAEAAKAEAARQEQEAEEEAIAARKAAREVLETEQSGSAAQSANTHSGHKFTDKNGDTTTFTKEEWDYLLSIWAYTGKAEEMIESHTIGELNSALAIR